MGRRNHIWFRKDTGWWVVKLDGKRVRLAERKFLELKLVTPQAPKAPSSRVCDVVESFLNHVRPRLSAETMRNYDWYGQAFSERFGELPAREFAPHHVSTFVSEKGWTGTTEFNARRHIFRVFSWAAEERILPANTLEGMRRPKPPPRGRSMTEDEFRGLMRAEKNPRFKAFLYALRATGCRPKEARTLTWSQVRDDRWVLKEHKTAHKTAKPRVIYLTAPTRKLMDVLRGQELKSGKGRVALLPPGL